MDGFTSSSTLFIISSTPLLIKIKPGNLSVDQSIHQSIHQSINQSINPSINSTRIKITTQTQNFCRAVTDPRDGKRVALKKMPNVFQNLASSKRVYREIKMLCFFKHENVIDMNWKFNTCFVFYVIYQCDWQAFLKRQFMFVWFMGFYKQTLSLSLSLSLSLMMPWFGLL